MDTYTPGPAGTSVSRGMCLEGQGDLVSIGISPVSHIIFPGTVVFACLASPLDSPSRA